MGEHPFFYVGGRRGAVARINEGTQSKARRNISLRAWGNRNVAARHLFSARGRQRFHCARVSLTRRPRHS